MHSSKCFEITWTIWTLTKRNLMNQKTRTSLAEILVDIAALRARKDPQAADKLTRLAADVAAGQPTVFDKLIEP
jgi:hypothetical protein